MFSLHRAHPADDEHPHSDDHEREAQDLSGIHGPRDDLAFLGELEHPSRREHANEEEPAETPVGTRVSPTHCDQGNTQNEVRNPFVHLDGVARNGVDSFCGISWTLPYISELDAW